ncbi:putative molybdopterin oxidoreductase, iron-sulfur binding subunit [Corallococcus coralloides DSM 2259]|uniref:Putative molybdopterin oxidoreductase, iron-sulfur binding subunit n=1 Tax=Corallococcus coralloides (strain ATCC 25202 / DSM 2259 / NBRC 100086 / M2) TaxID=1144275 RepID=H8MW61_CORCM|nr:TAT-variant-translocated molybdopterin oxidoreductase [Corallococcus coralloides]AFE09067.1 putative molybdopterin oxidoreductase, iron-sulfur binding subunit [Corallococcus coralloides DSM 2259]
MNTKPDSAPAQETPSSFALPVVSGRNEAAPHAHAHDDVVGEALEHASTRAVPAEGAYGKTYWLGLEEKLATPEFLEETRPEFPVGADLPPTGFARREFMQLMGASLALAGATACSTRPQDERMVAYTKTPPEVTPGNPLHYASGMTLGGHTSGLLITAREGRPVKIEGNPQHPVNQGAAGVFEQAFLLSLYDPQRARVLRQGNNPRSLRVLAEDISALVSQRAAADGGSRLRFLTEPISSPTLRDVTGRIQKKLPNARFHTFSSITDSAAAQANRALFGQPVQAVYELSRADVIVSLDADFLESRPENLALNRQFADRRDPKNGELNRLYVAEARMSITGGMADHRKRVKSAEIFGIAAALAQAVGGPAASLGASASGKAGSLSPETQSWVQAVAQDLKSKAGRSVVLAGERQPAAVHALAQAINAALGNVGTTVKLVPAAAPEASGLSEISALVADIKAGKVDTLVITATNPVYALPVDAGLAEVLDPKQNANRKALSVLYAGHYEDETSKFADWFVPLAHQLETWSDGRAADGTVSIAQPLIQPLFNGVPEAELFALFLDEPFRPAYQLVRDYWAAQGGEAGRADFETRWETWVSEGIVPGSTAAALTTATPDTGAASQLVAAYQPPAAGELEINFVHDYRVLDGRFGNNAWLQETPDPITKIVWENAAILSPATAKRLGLENNHVAELEYGGRKLQVPVTILPGNADDTVTVALGYGRTGLHEVVAKDIGFNANLLRSVNAPWFDGGAKLTKVRGSHKFARTQYHWRMEGRPLALDMSVSELAHPSKATEHTLERVQAKHELGKQNNLPDFEYAKTPQEGYKWGMSIDLSRCTGCNACVVACQAENNIPVVGKEQVGRGREMNWLRIDRYFQGDENDPAMVMQPVACVHCEKAPCEYVCPVNATVHSDEGLNDMVYNRCIGTRYCSNNCPYKVRRFNYLHYTQGKTPTEKMLMNPDVTVRNRGVMEKCTYCVQRIERVRINARVEKRLIQEKELQTACQQTCPTQAIAFGSLADPAQRVTQLHEDERAYRLLHELGTRPRTAHLIRLRNPNPALVPAAPAEAAPAHEGGH